MRRWGGTGAVPLVAMLCGCGSHGVAAPSKDFQAVFDASGDPVLLGGPARRGPERWLICRPGKRCVTAHERDNALQPGFQPAGTVMEASVRSVGRTFTDRAPWLGSVHAITAPRLTGRPRFGTWVKPFAGTWTGGWVGDEDQLAVEACRYRTGNGCVMLSGGAKGCASDDPVGARVGLALTGWYLFTLDSRNALDELCGAPGYASEAQSPVWRLGATVVRSAPLGPVIGPPRPTVRIFSRVQRVSGRLNVAVVDCATSCLVTLQLSNQTAVPGQIASTGARVRFTGKRTISVPAQGMRSGRLAVTVFTADGPGETGHAELRRAMRGTLKPSARDPG